MLQNRSTQPLPKFCMCLSSTGCVQCKPLNEGACMRSQVVSSLQKQMIPKSNVHVWADSDPPASKWPLQTLAPGTSLAVWWLGLRAFNARGMGLIPGQGTKIPHAAWCGQKKTKTKNQNKQTLAPASGSCCSSQEFRRSRHPPPCQGGNVRLMLLLSGMRREPNPGLPSLCQVTSFGHFFARSHTNRGSLFCLPLYVLLPECKSLRPKVFPWFAHLHVPRIFRTWHIAAAEWIFGDLWTQEWKCSRFHREIFTELCLEPRNPIPRSVLIAGSR